MKQKLLIACLILSAVNGAVGIGVGIGMRKYLPPMIPLWYSRAWGESQLANNYWFVGIAVGSMILGIGLALLINRIKIEKELQTMMLATLGIAQLIMCLGLLRIVFLIL